MKEGDILEDSLIIQLFWKRSENAILELSKKYENLCKSISYHILQNEQDVEECVNDAFLALWNIIPPEQPNPLQAYVCRIVRNLSLKKYHANTAQKRNTQYDMILEEIESCFESHSSTEDEVLAKELSKQINIFLGKLKKRDRVIFVQRYWYCMDISEIAEKMDMNCNQVTVKLHRIRKKLKKYLEKEHLV